MLQKIVGALAITFILSAPKPGLAAQIVKLGDRPEQLLYVGINVSNIEKSTDFYSKILGMKQIERPAGKAKPTEIMLSYSGLSSDPFVFLSQAPASKPPVIENGALVRLVFKVADAAAVSGRIKAAGYLVTREPATERPGVPTLVGFAKDPDGNTIEFIQTVN